MRRPRIPGWAWCAWYRFDNRITDAMARRAGYCNATPHAGSGGYPHWRCALDAGHGGGHRHLVYVWADGERIEYRPWVPDTPAPQQPWSRHTTPTRAQWRAKRRWIEEKAAAREGKRRYG